MADDDWEAALLARCAPVAEGGMGEAGLAVYVDWLIESGAGSVPQLRALLREPRVAFRGAEPVALGALRATVLCFGMRDDPDDDGWLLLPAAGSDGARLRPPGHAIACEAPRVLTERSVQDASWATVPCQIDGALPGLARVTRPFGPRHPTANRLALGRGARRGQAGLLRLVGTADQVAAYQLDHHDFTRYGDMFHRPDTIDESGFATAVHWEVLAADAATADGLAEALLD